MRHCRQQKKSRERQLTAGDKVTARKLSLSNAIVRYCQPLDKLVIQTQHACVTMLSTYVAILQHAVQQFKHGELWRHHYMTPVF